MWENIFAYNFFKWTLNLGFASTNLKNMVQSVILVVIGLIVELCPFRNRQKNQITGKFDFKDNLLDDNKPIDSQSHRPTI